jgi:quercetin dioxygenase-like cupin family protein
MSATPAPSPSTPGVRRTVLQAIPIPSLPGWESRLVLLEYPPGFKTAVHTHPAAATGYILEGEVVSQWEGSEEERYKTGDTFVDHEERSHVRSENVSAEKPLKMLMSYVIKVGVPNVTF